MSESRHLYQIERLIEPVRDMFSAIFFVAIGLLFNPSIMLQYWLPIVVITVVVVLGKVVSCGLATFLSGHDGRTSMRVGMSLSQIGEFSFIIAALGVSLKVTSDFLYPTVVAVSAVTTLLTPYLIKLADPLSSRLARAMPEKLAALFGMYSTWLDSLQPQGDRAELSRIIRRILMQVVVNLALVVAIFIVGGYFAAALGNSMSEWVADAQVQNTIVWGGALLLALPFLIATYRKLHALSMLLAEISVNPEWAGSYSHAVRRVIAEVIPAVSIIGIMLMITALSSRILPPTNLLILVLVGAAALVLVLWQRFVKLHSRLQIALHETLEQQPDEHH